MDTAEKIIIFCFLLEGVCCRDFNIYLPEKIKALSGYSVIIKCRFEIKEQFDKDLTERATGVWYKDRAYLNTNVVFNSSTSSQKSSMKGKITGKLKDKDCTTVFYDLRSNHSGQYFFRIEGEGKLKHIYKQANVSIDVIESPPKPRVQLYVEQKEVQGQEEVLEVLERSSVSLRCSAETLCSSPPPTLTWSSSPRIPLSESSRLQELISDLNFTATHREHGVTFTCTITYQLQDKIKTEQDSITLHVQYSPKNTTVSVLPSSSVLEGSSVTLICSSDANPAVNYTWSRESEGQLKQLQTGDTLTFNRTDPTHRGWYHCTAQNQHGSQNSSVMLDIQYAPKNMSALAIPSSSVLEGSSVTLICSSDANPAVNYTWSRESEGQMKQLQAGDTLTFNRTDPTHRGWYHCTAQNQHGSQNSSVMLDIQYFPQISVSSSCSRTDVTVCFCEADGNPSPELEWRLSGRPVTNSSNTFISEERLSSTVLRSSITLHQSLTNTSTLQCLSRNTRGTASYLFHLPSSVERLNHFSLLIGVVVVGLVVIWLLSAITCICVRKGNGKLSQTTQEGTKRIDQSTSEVAPHENQDDPVYVMMSSAEATANQDSVIYSPIVFTKSESQEFGSLALLDYAVMQDCSEGLLKTESSIGEFSRAREAQVIVSANVRTKEAEEELFEDSSQIYAKVKRCNP
ncbi:B-cell receptor CD22-like isoform X1 [Carassius gibelio]|uniref:B-cell receptor CD22-like isoform X1 n=1 Tax=Carassius gibelio TaxID=101364 RepID=UPI002279A4BF|nr:B-cell receptor CD22-like isoform X1 [Carassius gibelio]